MAVDLVTVIIQISVEIWGSLIWIFQAKCVLWFHIISIVTLILPYALYTQAKSSLVSNYFHNYLNTFVCFIY